MSHFVDEERHQGNMNWNGGAPEEEEEDNLAEEEEEEEGTTGESLPSVMGQDDPRRMQLTLEEQEIAWSIKGTLEASSDIDHVDIADFLIAQCALICGESLDPEVEVVNRLIAVQEFKEEYDIHDTLEEGYRAIEEFLKILSEYVIHHSFKEDEGTYVMVMDHQGFNTEALEEEANFREYMVGCYYILQALSCDMQTIRQGYVGIVDCGSIGWSMKNDYKILKEFLSQLFSVYPIEPKAMRHYNSGTIPNLLMGMATRVLPRRKREHFIQTGFRTEGRLRDIFLVPNVEAARQRTAKSFQEALKRRYENEKNFTLH